MEVSVDALRQAARKDSWSEETINLLIQLAENGCADEIVTEGLTHWVRDGHLFGVYSPRADITATYYPQTMNAYAKLAESQPKALRYLTDQLIEGISDIPVAEYPGLIETYMLIDPVKASDPLEDSLNRILKSKVADYPQFANRFKRMKKRLPKRGWRRFLS